MKNCFFFIYFLVKLVVHFTEQLKNCLDFEEAFFFLLIYDDFELMIAVYAFATTRQEQSFFRKKF